MAEDGSVTLDLLANDTDLDGDALSIESINGVMLTGKCPDHHGPQRHCCHRRHGRHHLHPDADYNGPVTFDYVVTDGNATDTGTVNGTVTAVNDAPVATDDPFTVAEDGSVTLDLLANDTDLDGDTLSIESINGVTLTGSAQTLMVPNGTVAIDAMGVVTFAPDADYNGPVSFDYVVTDGNATDTGTVNGTVTAVNDAPVATDDPFTVAEDGSVTLDLLANDTDLDGDTLSIESINGVTLTGSAQTLMVPNGTVTIDAMGVVTFTPDADYNGPVSFDYVVTDGNATDTGTVNGTVTAVNDAPVATDDPFTVAEDGSVTLDLLANDTDLDGDVLSIESINGVTLTGSAQTLMVPNGTVAIDAMGVITFTPDADYNGPVSFDYVVTDGNATDTGTVNGTVTAVPDMAVITGDATGAVTEDIAVTGMGTLTDTGNLTVIDPDAGEGPVHRRDPHRIPRHPDHRCRRHLDLCRRQQPERHPAARRYRQPHRDLHRPHQDGTTQIVTITINGANDAPVATDDPFTVAEDGSVTLDLLANDTDLDGGYAFHREHQRRDADRQCPDPHGPQRHCCHRRHGRHHLHPGR